MPLCLVSFCKIFSFPQYSVIQYAHCGNNRLTYYSVLDAFSLFIQYSCLVFKEEFKENIKTTIQIFSHLN